MLGIVLWILAMVALKVRGFATSIIRRGRSAKVMMPPREMSTAGSSDGVVVHLNHAGASPSPQCAVDRVIQHMELEQKLGGYAANDHIQTELQQVYSDVARLVQAEDPLEIALTESSTVAWTRLFYSMAAYQEEKRPAGSRKIILISEAEYAANIVACCQWARDHRFWSVLAIPSQRSELNGFSTGVIDMRQFRSMLGGRFRIESEAALDPSEIALVCITHIPTNSGIVNPVREIGQAIAQYNDRLGKHQESPIFYLVDACQSVGQLPVNVQEMHCHGLTGTGRKYLRAPRGTGFLYAQHGVSEILTPSHIDHSGAPIASVPHNYPNHECGGKALESLIEYKFRDGAQRFEFSPENSENVSTP